MILNESAMGPRVAEDVGQRDLELIQTTYGRLVYLASVIDPNTGRYEHYDAFVVDRPKAVSGILQRRHEEIFRNWIALSLQQKMQDVQKYISSLPGVDVPLLIDAWVRLAPYKNLVPASVQGPERLRHISDIEAILGLLQNVHGVASPLLASS